MKNLRVFGLLMILFVFVESQSQFDQANNENSGLPAANGGSRSSMSKWIHPKGNLPMINEEVVQQVIYRQRNQQTHIGEQTGEESSDFRPSFVGDILRQRLEHLENNRQNQVVTMHKKLMEVAERRDILKSLVQSEDPLTFDLLMKTFHQAHRGEIITQKEKAQNILSEHERAFLRPVVSVFAPESAVDNNSSVETKIYQFFEEQNGTVLKGSDVYVVTKLSGFTGEKIHIGIDLHEVEDSSENVEALTPTFLSEQLKLQKEMLLAQMKIEAMIEETGETEETTDDNPLEIESRIGRLQLRIQGKLAEKQKEFLLNQLEVYREIVEDQVQLAKKFYSDTTAKANKARMEVQQRLVEEQFRKIEEQTGHDSLVDQKVEMRKSYIKQRTEVGLNFLREILIKQNIPAAQEGTSRKKAQEKSENRSQNIERQTSSTRPPVETTTVSADVPSTVSGKSHDQSNEFEVSTGKESPEVSGTFETSRDTE